MAAPSTISFFKCLNLDAKNSEYTDFLLFKRDI